MSQANDILNYLKQGNTITPLEALKKFHCLRLAARINDLKEKGHMITKDNIKNTNNSKYHARYKLIGLLANEMEV
tara:strand:+ start:1037 stop:1261 length:225 start_codon:yes stop_codon:yes gene_type:complete